MWAGLVTISSTLLLCIEPSHLNRTLIGIGMSILSCSYGEHLFIFLKFFFLFLSITYIKKWTKWNYTTHYNLHVNSHVSITLLPQKLLDTFSPSSSNITSIPGFLILNTIYILGSGGCPVHCGMFSSLPGFHMLDAYSTFPKWQQ